MSKRSRKIGVRKKLPIRQAFAHEAHDFTVWLEQNIDILSEELGIPLIVEEREKAAGDFRVDLVCRDGQGNRVVIENQLEKSDHDHLGKLHTYLSGVGAKTGIWITPQPRPEHVEAIVNQNRITSADYEFYLVKVEAIQIDQSNPYPIFKIVAKPDDRGIGTLDRKETDLIIQETDDKPPETIAEDAQAVPEVMELPPVWCIYPRRDVETYNFFLTENVISTGLGNDLGDLSQVEPSYATVKEKWQHKYWLQNPNTARTMASIVHRFAHVAQPGDYIIYPPTWKEKKIHVGEITSDYRFEKRQRLGYNDLRDVRWFATLNRQSFGKKALRNIAVPLAFFQIRKEPFLKRLEKLLASD